MRILNKESLAAHGNISGRRAIVDILEAGLEAADPSHNVRDLMRVEGNRLIVGHPDFVPAGSPAPDEQIYDLSRMGRIYVVGAGKGIQYLARPIEDILGDRLTGGHVIGKHGDALLLERIGVTLGGHPVPDEGCVEGCEKILALCRDLREEDLVITLAANGVSSLLTLPVEGVNLEDVQRTTFMMQIERGAPTRDLNPIRNHLDRMKGGRISRYIQPARAIHIVARDPHYAPQERLRGYAQMMRRNFWLHTLPDCTTFAQAVEMLHRWDAWDAVPASVREHLTRADPAQETVKAAEFERGRFAIYGVMPRQRPMLAAMEMARELGFTPHRLARWVHAEASQAGPIIASMAETIEEEGSPFEPPCALFTAGELLVTVGQETGVGGRNQEYVLSAARRIAGSENIVMAGADTDGTDGPGGCFSDEAGEITCLAGGIVDGHTIAEAEAAGVDILDALRRHDTSPALWKLDSGIAATHNIAIGDLGVTLIMGRADSLS